MKTPTGYLINLTIRILVLSFFQGCKKIPPPTSGTKEIGITSSTTTGSASYLFYMDEDSSTFTNTNANAPSNCQSSSGTSGHLSCGRVVKMSQCNGGIKTREFCTLNTRVLPLLYFRHALTNGEYNYMENLTYYVANLETQISTLQTTPPAGVSTAIIQAQIAQKQQQKTAFQQKRDALQTKWQTVTDALNLLQQRDLVFEISESDPAMQDLQNVVKKFSDIFVGRRNRLLSFGNHTCLLDDNQIRCWGGGSMISFQSEIFQDTTIRDIAVSPNYRCVLRSAESLTSTQCRITQGNDATNISANPVKIVAGDSFACVLSTSSTPVICVGSDKIQQRIPAMMDVVDIVARKSHVCALHSQGVSCWSMKDKDEDNELYKAPVLDHPYAIFAGDDISCANDLQGFRCWGPTKIPAAPSGLTHPQAFDAADRHACAIQDEVVSCWGNNDLSQLNIPPTLQRPALISTGVQHSCAAHKGGITCWGAHGNDQDLYNDNTRISLNASFK